MDGGPPQGIRSQQSRLILFPASARRVASRGAFVWHIPRGCVTQNCLGVFPVSGAIVTAAVCVEMVRTSVRSLPTAPAGPRTMPGRLLSRRLRDSDDVGRGGGAPTHVTREDVSREGFLRKRAASSKNQPRFPRAGRTKFFRPPPRARPVFPRTRQPRAASSSVHSCASPTKRFQRRTGAITQNAVLGPGSDDAPAADA